MPNRFRVEFDLDRNKNSPEYRWRKPSCIAGFVDLAYSFLYIYLCLSWLYKEYVYEARVIEPIATTRDIYSLDPDPITPQRMWLILGMMGAAVYIPFNLFAIYYSIGMILVTYKDPKGGIDKNYDACDEAEDNLQSILSWRNYNVAALVLSFIVLIAALVFSLDYIKAIIPCVVVYGMLMVVKQHVKEIQDYIEMQEKKAILNVRRKSTAIVNTMIQYTSAQ